MGYWLFVGMRADCACIHAYACIHACMYVCVHTDMYISYILYVCQQGHFLPFRNHIQFVDNVITLGGFAETKYV